MLVVRTDINTRAENAKGVNCPRGDGLMTIMRRDHLAKRKTATDKIEVFMLSKSKNCVE